MKQLDKYIVFLDISFIVDESIDFKDKFILSIENESNNDLIIKSLTEIKDESKYEKLYIIPEKFFIYINTSKKNGYLSSIININIFDNIMKNIKDNKQNPSCIGINKIFNFYILNIFLKSIQDNSLVTSIYKINEIYTRFCYTLDEFKNYLENVFYIDSINNDYIFNLFTLYKE